MPEEKAKTNSDQLPLGINIVNHVSGRIKELKKLYNDIALKKSEMLIHQMLPNHMRRRAMSHNPKRIPFKYRKIHISQMIKSGLDQSSSSKKRPSRKYRRKPNNLLKEYNRRKLKNTWLETHIWHAKRFRMSNLWGYKIPFTTTDKRYKSSYKAAMKNFCLLQDMSFYGCIELRGKLDVLKREFSRIVATDIFPSITAKCFITGSREGSTDLFKADCYPYQVITNVKFIWKPDENDDKTLWIFVHPLAYCEVLAEIQSIFQTTSASSLSSEYHLLIRNPKFENAKTGVTIIELKDTINRFRLTGALSNYILSRAFKITSNLNEFWMRDLFAKEKIYEKAHKEQEEIFDRFKNSTPIEFPPHCILGFNIEDPRTNRQIKKQFQTMESFFERDIIDVSKNASISPMWKKDLRDELIKTKISNSELCKIRNQKQLIPTIASFAEKLQPISILLIQRYGYGDKNLGSGWDLIVPAGYGLSVWLSLIKFGAKAGGWKEHEMIQSEIGNPVFSPDSIAGKKEMERMSSNAKDKYFLKPPNKRTNYTKISIASPFLCPFNQLIKDWGGKSENFYVQRNLQKLKEIQDGLKSHALKINWDSDALLPIRIQMLSRGSPDSCSIICLPNRKDIKFWMMNRNKSISFNEALIADKNEQIRKALKFNHKKMLKRLRNQRVREKRRRQEIAETFVKITKSNTKVLIKEQFTKMCELWLPQNPTSIRHQCSREVIGYLTDSRFSFRLGNVAANGFVASQGLKELIELFNSKKISKPFVLVRATNSSLYHVASIVINTDYKNCE